MIRVLIADDHGLVRAGLTELIGTFEDVEIVGAAAGGDEAVAMAVELAPDIVLMDLEMPEVDGIAATSRIRESAPDSRVVILTSFSDRERILQALDAGAVGYLLKDAEPGELARGIAAAARGESPLDPRAAGTIIEARAQSHPRPALSEREREVLALLSQGMANKEIARRLGISEKTVKAHLTNVFRQIKVTDRTQAALWARSNGIAPLD
jgi:DNA-binding NarL/FixJ family response regulator